jgi:uncharacterized protein (DUF2141 family)
MKITFLTLVAFALSLTLYSFANSNADTLFFNHRGEKFAECKRSSSFALYNKDGSIPDEDYENYYKILKGEIINGSSTITFKNIPSGKYAVNILHDENKNGKIDKGFILPIEGIGFSNFQSIGFANRPNFSKASFELKENKTINVKVIYM